MIRFARALVALAGLAAATPCSAQPGGETGAGAAGRTAGDPAVAFVGVDVLTMESEAILRDQTVVVRGDRIVALGPSGSTEVPAGATTVDGRGKLLMPGLAEMHGHVPPPQAPAEDLEAVLFLYVANGITTVRGMLGYPGQLDLKGRIARGEIVGPNLYLAGPSFSGNSVTSPAQAAERARAQAAEGWDLLKVHPGISRAEYDSMAIAAREVGIRFGGHVPEDVGLLHALEMGQETFDHIDGYAEHLRADEGPLDEAALADVVRRTVEAGAWVVPTQVLWEVILGIRPLEELAAIPELKYAPPAQVRQWIAAHEQRMSSPPVPPEVGRRIVDARIAILAALHEAGAGILMGTDAPQQFSVPGFSLHRELRRMTDAGMSPYEILATGTTAVGRYFANEDDFGAVAAGKRADLVLLEANPLDDLANLERIAGVMVAGRWLPGEEIERRLAEIEARYAAAAAPPAPPS